MAFTFWQTAEDEVAFVEFLNQSGKVLVYPTWKTPNRESLNSSSLATYVANSEHRRPALFSLEEFGLLILPSSIHDDGVRQYLISPMQSPVIGYDPGTLSDGKLTPTNVYAYWERINDDEETKKLETKSTAFLKWARSVFRWLKIHAALRVEGTTLPSTNNVAERAKHDLELIHY